MLAAQQAGMWHPAGMGDHVHFLVHVFGVVRHPLGFVLDHQAALQLRVMRGDPGRTSVLVATQRLNAAQSEHVATRRVDQVGPTGQCPGDLGRRHPGLPEAMTLIRSRRPFSISASTTLGKASLIDSAM